MLNVLEDCEDSKKPVYLFEPHFKVFPEFHNSSYLQRYEELCKKLMIEGLYDRTTFFTSRRNDNSGESYNEPNKNLSMISFLQSLIFHSKLHFTE